MAKKDSQNADERAWDRAFEISHHFKAVPATFSVPVRTLLADAEAGGDISHASRFLLDRLLKSRSCRAPYAGALQLNFPEKLENTGKAAPRRAYIEACDPFSHAVILTLIYSFRRIRAMCEEEELKFILPPLQESIQVGGYVGRAIPEVGFGIGTLLGGFRYLGLALLTRKDGKTFKEYRKHLKTLDQSFDSKWEREAWECSSTQVGALLVQAFGFGVPISNALHLGVETDSAVPLRKDRVALGTHVVNRWIESFKMTGEPPHIPAVERAVLPIELRPGKAKVDQLSTRVRSIPELGETLRWLELSKVDADKPFVKVDHRDAGPAEEAEEDVELPDDASGEDEFLEMPSYESLPDDMQKQFSKEDFETLTDDVADLLNDLEEEK